MPDHSLATLCALGAAEPGHQTVNGLVITENPGLAMASLAARSGRTDAVRTAFRALAGIDLPDAGGLRAAGDWAAFWTSPDQWMVTAPFATHEDIAAIVKASAGDAASVTEQTDGWVRFEIEGARACDMFERLCNVDVRRMAAGQATRCQVEHLGCFLLCQAPGAAFSLLTLRSAAASMLHALKAAAASLP